ncbi:MAG: flagellar biosynthetic protein FliR [Chloroflexota bacterium]|nr:flagellar biosynthetic protein FliR [Dehalococcoidia bacterium]MDW8254874.1 flagellar biosynthetic protein FliR [Chloroflexota bacterium]
MILAESVAAYVTAFALALARVSGMVAASPIYSSRALPGSVKIGLAVALTIVLVPPGSALPPGLPRELLPFLGLLALNTVIGLAIGFAASLVFGAIQTGAGLIGTQIGFGLSQVIDPMFEGASNTLDTFYTLFATMVFLTLSGHHWLIAALQRAFETIPLTGAGLSAELAAGRVLALAGELWVIAFQIALPVVGALLLTDVALGILTRTVPQMNVFVVSLPLKVTVGLVVVLLTLPVVAAYLDGVFRTMTAQAGMVVR